MMISVSIQASYYDLMKGVEKMSHTHIWSKALAFLTNMLRRSNITYSSQIISAASYKYYISQTWAMSYVHLFTWQCNPQFIVIVVSSQKSPGVSARRITSAPMPTVYLDKVQDRDMKQGFILGIITTSLAETAWNISSFIVPWFTGPNAHSAES